MLTSSKTLHTEARVGCCRVKGIAVRAGLRAVAETYGLETVQTVYEAGSSGLKRAIVPGLAAFGILSTSWYDVEIIGELLEIIVRLSPCTPQQKLMRQIADAVAIDNVTGAYRSLFRLIATRPLLVAHAQRVYGNYFDTGTLEVTSARDGELFFRVRTPKHHPALCLITALVVERLLLELGYKGSTLDNRRCKSAGGVDCSFEIDYVT